MTASPEKILYCIEFLSYKKLCSVKGFSLRWAVLPSFLKNARSGGQRISRTFPLLSGCLLILWAPGKEKQHSCKKVQASNIVLYFPRHTITPRLVLSLAVTHWPDVFKPSLLATSIFVVVDLKKFVFMWDSTVMLKDFIQLLSCLLHWYLQFKWLLTILQTHPA